MESGTTMAFYLSVRGANRITLLAMQALDHTGVPGPSGGEDDLIVGAPGLLRLRAEAVDAGDWQDRFDAFLEEWMKRVLDTPPAISTPDRNSMQYLDRHADLVHLTRECIEVSKGYIRRDLWDDNLVRKYIRGGKEISFSGVFREILVRRMREAAPQHLLGISRERVYRLFKANRERVDILKDPLHPPPKSPHALVKTIADRLALTDVDGIQDDLDRYLQACGRGPETIAELGETDFFDGIAEDPWHTDNIGLKVPGSPAETYPNDLGRLVHISTRPSAGLPKLDAVQELLKLCLGRLKELDPQAYAIVRRYMETGEPDVDDPIGVLFRDACRQLRACLVNKIR